MKTKISLLLFIVMMVSCTNNIFVGDKQDDAGSSKLTISFNTSVSGNSAINKTVVADFTTQITKWTVTMKNTTYGSEITETVTPSNGTVTLTKEDISPGEWQITITGTNSGGQTVAAGTTTCNLNDGGDTTVKVNITFNQTSGSKGSYSLKLKFPKIVDDILGVSIPINKIVYKLDSGSETTIEKTSFTDVGSNTKTATLTGSGIDSGIHSLNITFYTDYGVAGSFTEAVNIWDNAESNRWVGDTGSLCDCRTFDSADFLITNPYLKNITIDNSSKFSFSSGTFEYIDILITSATIRFTPEGSVDGQKIEYRIGTSGDYTTIYTGQLSEPIAKDGSGTTTIQIKVTAPNGSTTKEYTLVSGDGYIVSFDGNDTGVTGSVSSIVVKSGETFKYPENGFENEIDGFTHKFIGWSTNRYATTGSDAGIDSGAVGSNTTYYAIWTAIGCKTSSGTIFYDKGRGNYTDGWRYMEVADKSDESACEWSDFTAGSIGDTSDKVGYGKSNTVRIAKKSSSGAAYICSNYTSGAIDDWFLPSIGELEKIIENKDKLTGFNTDSEYWSSSESAADNAFGSKIGTYSKKEIAKSENKLVRAVRAFSQAATCVYCVVYDGNTADSGSVPEDGEYYEKGLSATVKGNTGNLVKSGYALEAWNTSADGNGTTYNEGSNLSIDGDIMLYAKWAVKENAISYTLNGGTNAPGNLTNFTVDTPDITLADPTRTGYTFDGWFDNPGCTGTKVTSIQQGTTDDKAFYAKWAANSYTVTFDKQGGTGGSDSVTAIYEGAMPTATVPTLTGYTFAGYYDAASGGVQYYKADMLSAKSWDKLSDATLHARWTAITYVITYNLNGGTNAAGNPVNYTVETADITLANPTRAGYAFDGWYAASDFSGSAVTTIPLGSTEAKEFWAKWVKSDNPTVINGTSPTPQTGYKRSGDNGLVWGDYTYWCYDDNSNMSYFKIIAYDISGTLKKIFSYDGYRYLSSITVDSSAKVVKFTVQSGVLTVDCATLENL